MASTHAARRLHKTLARLNKTNSKMNGKSISETEPKQTKFTPIKSLMQFTCPPYYGIEKYSGGEGDLSHMSDLEFDQKIRIMFHNLKDMIKKSNYKEKCFHPLIFTVGTVRRGDGGLLDMDFLFQTCAKEAGFVLHDKLITVNNAPGAGFTFRRNWDFKFLCKTHETTLVFLRY